MSWNWVEKNGFRARYIMAVEDEATNGYLVRFRANAQDRLSRCPFFTRVDTRDGPR